MAVATVLQLDERWSFVMKKTNQAWIWIALCRKTRKARGICESGDRSEKTCRRLWETIPQTYRRGHCYTDLRHLLLCCRYSGCKSRIKLIICVSLSWWFSLDWLLVRITPSHEGLAPSSPCGVAGSRSPEPEPCDATLLGLRPQEGQQVFVRLADGVIRRLLAPLAPFPRRLSRQRDRLVELAAPASVTRARACQDLRPGQPPP